MIRIFAILLLALDTVSSHAWNSTGHRLVAQIAYDNLKPEVRTLCDQYNKSLNHFSKSANFVSAASWLDTIKNKDVHWYDQLHYIDIPFSKDGTTLPPQRDRNALWAIKKSMAVLSSPKASKPEKGLALRILIHVVGDIHQPLHTITLISEHQPQGDLGGNLFKLGKNSIAGNLHEYWDKGAGVLRGSRQDFQLRNKAQQLENRWSCSIALAQKKPEQWIQSSHHVARTEVYNIYPGTIPSKRYQLNAQNLSQKQILFAGCRLAYLLNTLSTTV